MAIRRSLGDVDEAPAVGDLAADEEVAPERLLLAQRLLLVDGLDAELVAAAHRIVVEVDRPVAKVDGTAGRPEHAGHHLDQGRLAGAVVADQADDLVAADREVDVAERPHRAERHLDGLEPDDARVVADIGRDLPRFPLRRHRAPDPSLPRPRDSAPAAAFCQAGQAVEGRWAAMRCDAGAGGPLTAGAGGGAGGHGSAGRADLVGQRNRGRAVGEAAGEGGGCDGRGRGIGGEFQGQRLARAVDQGGNRCVCGGGCRGGEVGCLLLEHGAAQPGAAALHQAGERVVGAWGRGRCGCIGRRRPGGAGAHGAAAGGDDALGERQGRVALARVLLEHEQGGAHVPVEGERVLQGLAGEFHQPGGVLLGRLGELGRVGCDQRLEGVARQQGGDGQFLRCLRRGRPAPASGRGLDAARCAAGRAWRRRCAGDAGRPAPRPSGKRWWSRAWRRRRKA